MEKVSGKEEVREKIEKIKELVQEIEKHKLRDDLTS